MVFKNLVGSRLYLLKSNLEYLLRKPLLFETLNLNFFTKFSIQSLTEIPLEVVFVTPLLLLSGCTTVRF